MHAKFFFKEIIFKSDSSLLVFISWFILFDIFYNAITYIKYLKRLLKIFLLASHTKFAALETNENLIMFSNFKNFKS